MIDPKLKLDIFHFDGTNYNDYSDSLVGFADGRTQESVTISDADYVYVGFYKPFRFLYSCFAPSGENGNSSVLSAEVFNGSWDSSNLNLHDGTIGFSRNGFIQWDIDTDFWKETTINGLFR